jgi:septum formation protein
LGIGFEVVVPGVEELDAGDPEFLVIENARRKARAVAAPAGGLVIACDTDVVLDGEVLGKPADAAEARAYLDRMGGRSHTVMSGLVVLEAGEERSGLERTEVVFKELSESEKQRYVNFGEWEGRSGGYAIQTLGSTLVERLEGSVSNVVGLPVGLLAELAPSLFERP